MMGSLAALASSFTWAIGTLAYSELQKKYSAFSINFFRAVAALPLFLMAAYLSGDWHQFSEISNVQVAWLSMSILASYLTGDVLFLLATRRIGIPGALAICSSYPVLSALAGALFLGQVLKVLTYFALALTVAGVIIVILSDVLRSKSFEKKKGYWLGVFMAWVSSWFWALNTYANAKVGPGLSAHIANSVRMIVALFACGIVASFTKRSGSSPLLLKRVDIPRYGWVFCLEGFGGAFCFVYGLLHAPLAIAAALSSLAPALSVPLTWWRGTEKVPLLKMIGVFLVVLGVVGLVLNS